MSRALLRRPSTSGAQLMCWTFIILYGMTTLGLTAAEAQGTNPGGPSQLLHFVRGGSLRAGPSIKDFTKLSVRVLHWAAMNLYCQDCQFINLLNLRQQLPDTRESALLTRFRRKQISPLGREVTWRSRHIQA